MNNIYVKQRRQLTTYIYIYIIYIYKEQRYSNIAITEVMLLEEINLILSSQKHGEMQTWKVPRFCCETHNFDSSLTVSRQDPNTSC